MVDSDERKAIILEMASRQVPTHKIRRIVGVCPRIIREVIRAARASGAYIQEPPREKADYSALYETILDAWATGEISMQELADRFTDGSYGRCRMIISRFEREGDPRAITIARQKEMEDERRRELAGRPDDSRRPPMVEEIGIRLGHVVVYETHTPQGNCRINTITLSAGLSPR